MQSLRVRRPQHLTGDRELVAAVLHAADVLGHRRETARRCDRPVQQEIVSLFVVPVGDEVDAPAQNAEVHSDIFLARPLPFELGVAEAVARKSSDVAVVGTPKARKRREVVVQILVAGHTVGNAQLEIGMPRERARERLLTDLPAEPKCREGAPAIVVAKARGTIRPQAGRQEIAIFVRGVGACEERHQIVARPVSIVGHHRRRVAGILELIACEPNPVDLIEL